MKEDQLVKYQKAVWEFVHFAGHAVPIIIADATAMISIFPPRVASQPLAWLLRGALERHIEKLMLEAAEARELIGIVRRDLGLPPAVDTQAIVDICRMRDKLLAHRVQTQVSQSAAHGDWYRKKYGTYALVLAALSQCYADLRARAEETCKHADFKVKEVNVISRDPLAAADIVKLKVALHAAGLI